MAGVREEIYRPQVAPGGSTPLAGAPADAFGAGVGRVIEQAGGQLEQANLTARRIEQERQKDIETAATAVRISQLGADLDGEAEQAKLDTAATGGAGFTTSILASHDKGSEEILGGITSPAVRREASVRLAEMRARRQSDGSHFEAVARVAKQFSNAGQAIQLANVRVRANSDPNILFEELANLDFLGSGLKGPPGKVEEFLRDARSDLWENFIRGQDPQRAREILSSGAAMDYLTPEAVDRLTSRTDTRIHQQEVEARAEQTRIVAQQKEEEATYVANAANGVAVDPDEGERLAARAEARGDTSAAVGIRAHAVGAQAASAYDKALPSQITARLAEIEKDPKWQESLALVVEHKALEEKLNQRRNDEPHITAPNLNDPKDMARFEAQVRADAKSRGVPPTYIFGDLKNYFEPMMKRGEEGQREVLAAIGRFSDNTAFEMARQLAPSDGVFQMAATLEGDARSLALAGRGALTSSGVSKDQLVTPEEMRERLDRIEGALAGVDPDFRQAAKETSVAIAAQLHRLRGKSKFDDGLADEAVRLALGGRMRGSRKLGGIGEVNGQDIVLPDDMDQEDFDRRYWRATGATQAWAGGRSLSFEELRRSYRLVSAGDGVYQWRDGYGRVVVNRQGEPVYLHIRQIKPAPPVQHGDPLPAEQRWMRNRY